VFSWASRHALSASLCPTLAVSMMLGSVTRAQSGYRGSIVKGNIVRGTGHTMRLAREPTGGGTVEQSLLRA
jgi:hypothetical protein